MKVSHADPAFRAARRHQVPTALVRARIGDLLFVSGIPGFDDKGALADGFEAQFGFVVANIKRVLGEAGATFRDLVKVNVLLTRASDVATMNVLYASAFGPAPYPARTTCVVQALPDPKMLIEIEAWRSLQAGRVTDSAFALRATADKSALLYPLTASAWLPSAYR